MKLRTSIVAPLTIIAALAAVPSGYAGQRRLAGRSSPRRVGLRRLSPRQRRQAQRLRLLRRRPRRLLRRLLPAPRLPVPRRLPRPPPALRPLPPPPRPRARSSARGSAAASAAGTSRSASASARARASRRRASSCAGKAIKTVKGNRVTAPIVLRGLPKGTFSLRIRAVTTEGKVLNGTRTYHTCAAKKRSHVPTL